VIRTAAMNAACLRHIQALLGHSSPDTTVRYGHLTAIVEQNAFDTINGLFNTLHAIRTPLMFRRARPTLG
jgi:integrase